MPLIKRSSKAARAVNIRRLIDEGYPPRQAVAIAYSTQRAARARNRAGGSMGAKAHRDAAIEAEKATRAQSGAAAVASSQAASDHARAAEAAAKASDSRTDFRAAAQAHDAAASAAWLVGDSARSERHTNAMDRSWRAATRSTNAAGGKRRNRAGKVRPKDEADARKIARDALQKAEKAIRSLRFDPESGLIAQEDRAVASFNRLRDRATDAAPYLPRDENDAITDALRNLRAMLDESIANASTVAKQAQSKIYAAADREASIERLARAFQREGHSLADARKIARFRHENRAGGKRRNRAGARSTARKPSARSYAERLRSNADDFHSYRIDYETFSNRNKRIWSEVDAAGKKTHEGVLKLLREEAGKGPARR